MISQLLNKTIFKIENTHNRIDFYCSDGHIYSMYHEQDCCESVSIDDINGDLDDLIGNPVLLADESSKSNVNFDGTPIDEYDSCTWTFYRLGTIKGYVDIRWYGSSNGYYSEEVSVEKSSECYLDEWRDYRIDEIIKNNENDKN